MQFMLNIVLCVVCSVGELIFCFIECLDVILVNEKDVKDYVIEVDCVVEQIIVVVLCKVYLIYVIMGEEGGFIEGSGEGVDYFWVIDLLDGIINFIYGVLYFVVSIVCKYKGCLEYVVVFDLVCQEEFIVSCGCGVVFNGCCLCVSGCKSLEGVLFGIGFLFCDNQIDNFDNYLNMFCSLVGQIVGICCVGVVSLDLVYVVVGCYDVFWEFGLFEWDMVVGVLLVQEVGGLVSDFIGSYEFFEKGYIVVGNIKCFKVLLIIIQLYLLLLLKC